MGREIWYVTSEKCKNYTLSTKLFKHVKTSWCKAS